MRKRTIWILVAALVAAVAPARSAESGWAPEDSYDSDLRITRVEVEALSGVLADLKRGGEASEPANAVPGQLMDDAYTAPHSGFSEEYTFTEGLIDHKVAFCVLAPGRTNFAFAWQPCGSGVVYPPLPRLLGTTIDGNDLWLTLPAAGCYLLTVGILGLDPGDWDWMVFADYAGAGPIWPLAPDIDTFGGSKTTLSLYDGAGDPVGMGASSARPWCFTVTP